MAFLDFFRRRGDPADQTPAEATPISLAMTRPVGEEQVRAAEQTLERYKRGKTNLDARIRDNEQWYKMRQEDRQKGQLQSRSAWLFNCIANKHAEAMDSFPRPNILPREEGDQPEAKILSSIIPVILDHTGFEEVYSDVQMYKLKTGTGVYGVFWDPSELNGLGDVRIRKVDILNLFWEPGVTDIQDSPNLFYTQLVDNDKLRAQYPQLTDKLSTPNPTVIDYQKEDALDTSDKSTVVDWYYKRNVGGRDILHFCKFCDGVVLYSTEDDPDLRERGVYDHGEYPFIFETLYRVEGSPAGIGFVDVGKGAQADIDIAGQALMQNLIQGARPRYFTRIDGAINEDEFNDWTKSVVHVEGNLGEDSIRPMDTYGLSGVYVDVLNNKIEELKETTGNRDVSSGGTTGGVTAASGIAAMQEAGAKLARDNNKAAYRAYREMILMVIELIRQFYDVSRTFRIVGERGQQEFVAYNNAQLQLRQNEFGMIRRPVFDIEVTAEKASPYSRMAQNELALSFYQQGFFNPQMADQALMCLDMMDFDGKDKLVQKISQQAGMLQQMLMLAQMVDQAHGTTEVTDGIMAQYGMMPAQTGGGEMPSGETERESPVTANARERVAESTQI